MGPSLEKINFEPQDKPNISIIVPVLNEAERILSMIRQVQSLNPFEYWIVDGGSTDGTPNLAGKHTDRVLFVSGGLPAQLNLGGWKAKGDILFFVHADSRIPENALQSISQSMKDPRVAGGGFHLKIRSDRRMIETISRLANLRARILGAPLGDQGIFVRKEVFIRLNGFRSDVLLEDLDFSLRMKKQGRVVLLSEQIITSPRKWERYGVLGTTLAHLRFLIGHFIHANPEELKKRYASFKNRAR